MDRDELGWKLAIAVAGMGAVLLVLRVVGGRGGGSADEETDDDEDEIDRVDTGRSDEDRSGSSVETGLERVSTDDDEDGTAGEAGGSSESEWETDMDASEAIDTDDAPGASGEDDSDDEVPVRATGGRFDDLDLFDYVAIAGAAFEAAREEYRNRT